MGLTRKQIKALKRRKSWERKRNIRNNNTPDSAKPAFWLAPHTNRTYRLFNI